MALIQWQPEYDLGIESIDNQHKQLVEIVNKFDEAMHKGKGSRIMNSILDDLIKYTEIHFADEEKFMAAGEYSGLKKHRAQHRQLLQKVERFKFDFNQNGRRITAEVQDFLRYWLTSHILHEDTAYAAELKAAKV